MVDPEAAGPDDRLGERGDGVLVQLFDRAAGGAYQVMVMTWFAPHVGRDMSRALQALSQAGLDQRIQ